MLCTVASTKRVVRKKARTGKEQWRKSRVPEQTSNSRGARRRNRDGLTKTPRSSGARAPKPATISKPPSPKINRHAKAVRAEFSPAFGGGIECPEAVSLLFVREA